MARCIVTGKTTRSGNNVSHANNKTKRQFKANLQKVRRAEPPGIPICESRPAGSAFSFPGSMGAGEACLAPTDSSAGDEDLGAPPSV